MNSLLKFDGPRLEDLLERVQRELGPQVAIVEANRIRKGGVGGFFAKEWFEVVVDPDSVPTIDPFLAMASAVADVRETARPFSSEEPVVPAAPERSMASPSAPPAPERAGAAAVATPGVEQATGWGPATFETALAIAQRAASPVVGVSPSRAAPGRHATAPPAGEASGVAPPPTRRLRHLDLAELLAHLDPLVPAPAPPMGPGAVVAVVGDPTGVRPVAVAVAARLGLAEADVVVAGPQPVGVAPWLAVTDPRTARARAGRWRHADRPTVVAVELSPGADGHAWAAAMLEALGADQVRLVAKAWQLTDQLGAKASALGGVDGLDLVEVDAAAEPELFLELDLAVLGIDGRPATPELWAALLYERRTDERDQ